MEQEERERLQDLKTELDEIKHEVAKKQDRIRPHLWIPFIIWIMTQSFAVVWGAATLVSQLSSIKEETKDRYYNTWAMRDFKLRDRELEKLEQRINDLEIDAQRHEDKPWHNEAGLELQRFKDHTKGHQ